ncbi:hypothetical protein JXJ21_26580, partial [candidate division KSB1 bacterium]|nr:hypothetical protein [candidate division KSB1 bacterium]
IRFHLSNLYLVIVFSMFLNLNSDSSATTRQILPAPISVLSFSSAISVDCIELTWLLASHDSNSVMELQRSDDNIHFRTVNQINGIPIDSFAVEFSYRDEPVEKHVLYYRLRCAQNDEAVYFSDAFKVEMMADSMTTLQTATNPTNPTTPIHFEILKRNRVILRIYDIMGQNVRTLIDAYLKPGEYALQWNGNDDFGKDLDDGDYFYQILIDNYFETRRLVLLR